MSSRPPPLPPHLQPQQPQPSQITSCPYCNTMMQCPPHLAGQVVACPHCGGQIQLPGGSLPAPMPIPPPKQQFAISTHSSPSQYYAPSDGLIRSGGIHPVLAALLSLILVGLPQMIMGQGIKGVVMLISAIVLGALTGCIACLIVWPVALIDAVMIANKLQRGQPVHQWEFF